MRRDDRWVLWLRWVMANAFGEMLGLGATCALAVSCHTCGLAIRPESRINTDRM